LKTNETTWRLKSKALWLEKGDNNTKYFHEYANHHKNVNTIWKMPNQDGSITYKFEFIAGLGVEHFHNIYKE
jgi:hypothetical protein